MLNTISSSKVKFNLISIIYHDQWTETIYSNDL